MKASTVARKSERMRRHLAANLSPIRPARALVCSAIFVVSVPVFDLHANTLPIPDFVQMAARCGPSVDVSTLASVAATESGFEALSVHDNTTGATATMQNAEQGAAIVKRLLEEKHSVDVGLMQINSANFQALDLTVAKAFDPCASIGAAAELLSQAYAGGTTHGAQQAALRAALSTYNTGNAESGIRNGYVRRVTLAAARIVPAIDLPASGVSTPEPRPRPAAAVLPPDWKVWSDQQTAPPAGGGAEAQIIDFKEDDNHG